MIRNLGLIGKKKYVAISLGVLVASVLLAFAVGQFWFGWGYTADNEEIGLFASPVRIPADLDGVQSL